MKIFHLNKFSSLAAVPATVMGALSMAISPTLAAIITIKFCGSFAPVPGGVGDSFIKVDSEKIDSPDENFGLLAADIKTNRPDLSPVSLNYTFDIDDNNPGDFTSIVESTTQIIAQNTPLGTDILNFPEEVKGWRFDEGSLGTFYAIFPKSFLSPDGLKGTIENNYITEIRDRIAADKDKPKAIPEPITTLGAITALGFGFMYKKKQLRNLKKEK